METQRVDPECEICVPPIPSGSGLKDALRAVLSKSERHRFVAGLPEITRWTYPEDFIPIIKDVAAKADIPPEKANRIAVHLTVYSYTERCKNAVVTSLIECVRTNLTGVEKADDDYSPVIVSQSFKYYIVFI